MTVTGVGAIQRGQFSGDTLGLSFNEAGVAGIVPNVGWFQVTLADAAGAGSTVWFVGAPSTAKSPGSLKASATVHGNILTVSIGGSDTRNFEPIIVTGIGIETSPTAALGPIEARMSGFTGSLAGGAANDVLDSPGSVVARP